MEIDLARFIVENEIMDMFVKNSGDTMRGELKINPNGETSITIKEGTKLIFNG